MSSRVSRFVVGFALAAGAMLAMGAREAKAQYGYGYGYSSYSGYGGYSTSYYRASSFGYGGFGGCAPVYAPPPPPCGPRFGYSAGYVGFGGAGYYPPPPRRSFGFSFNYGRSRGFHPGFHGRPYRGGFGRGCR